LRLFRIFCQVNQEFPKRRIWPIRFIYEDLPRLCSPGSVRFKTALQVWAPDLIGWGTEGPDDTYQREADFAAHPVPTRTTYALTINEVMVDGSLAIVRDSWTETTRQDNGPDKVTTYRSFEVWRRQLDNSWKISRWIDGPPMHVPDK
jgi:ketosteroid isomerase-like protein